MATTTPATQVAQANPAKPKAPTPIGNIPGVGMQATSPASDLRGQTLSVAPTADRGQLAQNYINTWDAQEAPKFQADVNTATSNHAALGQLGSGGLRTSLGDLTAQHANDRNAAYSKYYNDALGGSIDDAYKNVGIAQQQQAFQTGLQNQTFNQNLAGRQQENQEYNDLFNQNFSTNAYNAGRGDTAFNQAATVYQLGSQGNPSAAYQNLANQYGASAQNSFGGLANTVGASGSAQNANDILSLLRQGGLLGGKAAGNPLPTPTPIYSDYPTSGGVNG